MTAQTAGAGATKEEEPDGDATYLHMCDRLGSGGARVRRGPGHHQSSRSEPSAHISAREHRQKARIKGGKADGQLTKAEMDKLEADEAAVRAEEKVYRESGDGLDKAERKDLQKDLNKTSREIRRAKRNGKS